MRHHNSLKTEELRTTVNHNCVFLAFVTYSLLSKHGAVFTEIFVCRDLGVRNLLKQIEFKSVLENAVSFSG